MLLRFGSNDRRDGVGLLGLEMFAGSGAASGMHEDWKWLRATDDCGARDDETTCEFSSDGAGGSILCPDTTAANAGFKRGVV